MSCFLHIQQMESAPSLRAESSKINGLFLSMAERFCFRDTNKGAKPSSKPKNSRCPRVMELGVGVNHPWASLVVQTVKNSSPAMKGTQVQSLGWEDPLKEDIATHSSILAWRIPMEKGAWQATVRGVAKSLTRLINYACTHTTNIHDSNSSFATWKSKKKGVSWRDCSLQNAWS